MSNDNENKPINFNPPKDPREKAVWLRRWVRSIFKVYGSVMEQAAKAMPEKKIEQIIFEVDAAQIELMNLIDPEKWEKED